MDNILRRGGLEVPEPFRRFLQGESDSSLGIEQYQEGDTLNQLAQLRTQA
jgi:HSP20 family protein